MTHHKVKIGEPLPNPLPKWIPVLWTGTFTLAILSDESAYLIGAFGVIALAMWLIYGREWRR